MAVSIIHSESQKTLAGKVFSDISRLLSESDRRSVFLIVPETSKMDIERAYMEHVGSPGIMDLEILSFSRFCLRVLDEAGAGTNRYIDETGKSMLVYRALLAVEDQLTIFRNLCSDPRFVSEVISVIGEMKRSLISPDLLAEKSPEITDTVSSAKIREISLIMKKYFSLLDEAGLSDPQDRYTDTAALLTNAGELKRTGAEKLPESRIFRILDSAVFVLGFGELRDFTPQEYSILRILARYTDLEVSVVMGASEDPDEAGCFAAGKRCMEGLRKIDPSAEILYLLPEQKCTCSISIINARDTSEEISMIAGEIRKAVSSGKYRYKDIVIMSADQSRHRSVLKNIFREAGIPVYMDEKKAMKDTALGRAVSSVLKVLRSGWRNTHVISYMRSGFANCEQEEADIYENHMLAAGLRFKSRIFDDQRYYRADGTPDTEMIRSRDRILGGLYGLDEGKRSCSTAGEFCDLFSDFFAAEGYEEKTTVISSGLALSGRSDEAVAAVKAWNLLVEMLDQIRVMGSDITMNFEGFCGLLKSGLDQAVSGTIPHFIDCVQFSAVRVLPAGKPKVLYLAGMTSDNYPARMGEEGLLNDRDRSLLSGILGFRIPSLIEDKADEDVFTAYTLTQLPEETLVFSAAAEAGDEADIIKQTLMRCGGTAVRIRAESDAGPDSSLFFSADSLMRALAGYRSGMSREWSVAEALVGEDEKASEKLFAVRNIKKRASEDIKVMTELVRERYGLIPDMSVSQLEKYSSCPFSHYSSYLLRLRPREVRRIDPSRFGSILHGILELAASRFAREYGVCASEEDKQAVLHRYETADHRKFAEELMDKVVERDSMGIFKENGFFAAEGRSSLRLAESMLKRIFGNISGEKLLPAITEWGFSAENGNALEITLRSGEKIHFRGKVDRVDIGDNAFRLVDYKSGQIKIHPGKWQHGLSLQLPVYVAAFMNAYPGMRPEDVAYIKFERKIVDIDVKNADAAREKAEEEIRKMSDIKKSGMDTERLIKASEHALEMALEFSERLLDGEFPVMPRRMEKEDPACRYCNYMAVCGFDKYCKTVVLRSEKEGEDV